MPTKTDCLYSEVTVEIRARLDEPFSVVPFSDVHRESPRFAHEEWQEFCYTYGKRVKDGENIWFIGGGDYCDCCSTSERAILDCGGLHDTTRFSMRNMYRGLVRTMANELSFMRGHLLGLLGGNHYFILDDGETTDQALAKALDTRYLGVCALIHVRVVIVDKRGRPTGQKAKLDIFAHHGKGGGKTISGTFKAIEDMQQVAVADLYLMGHTHGKGVVPAFTRIRPTPTKRGQAVGRAHTPYLGRTGSFLKTYESGQVAYGVDNLYPACALGNIELEYTPRLVSKDGLDLVELKTVGKA